MNPRTIILIVIAILLAGALAFLARSFLTAGQTDQTVAAAAGPPMVQVLVASQVLPIGRILTQPDLRWQDWPQTNLHPSYVSRAIAIVPPNQQPAATATRHDYGGFVVRAGIAAGQPITLNRLVAPNDYGFLAAAIRPGMRGLTIGLSRTSSLGGNVQPGDRVDIILTQQVVDDEGVGHTVGETVFQNVRILAIDTRTNPQRIVAARAQQQAASNQRAARRDTRARTATLEVTQKMAEEAAILARLGQYTLSLRSITRPDGVERTAVEDDEELPQSIPVSRSWGSDVSALLPEYNDREDRAQVIIARGGSVQIIEFEEEQK